MRHTETERHIENMLAYLTDIESLSCRCVELDSADELDDLFEICRVYVRLLMIEVCGGGDVDGVAVALTIFSLRPICFRSFGV